jgi:ABC-2 type transport system ATP-binding protein
MSPVTPSSGSSDAPTIEASGLRKHYGDVHALAGLDLVAPAGQVTAILGPNGAGKTTFVKAVATLLKPDAGSLRVAGIDAIARPDLVRRAIGLAGQNAAVEPALTGRENLVMVAKLFGHDAKAAKAAAQVVLDEIGLSDDADRQVKGYSGGMRRRLDLGASLVGAPKVLLLDEPTTGLDPRTRIELWESIRSLVRGGTDVLLTTQYLEEADQLADEIVVIDHGRAIARGTSAELKRQVGGEHLDVHVRGTDSVAAARQIMESVATGPLRTDADSGALSAPVTNGIDTLSKVLRDLESRGVDIVDIGLRRPTLDDVFMKLTGHGASQEESA